MEETNNEKQLYYCDVANAAQELYGSLRLTMQSNELDALWQRLSDVLLLRIFYFLPPSDLLTLRLTSRKFISLLEEGFIWKSVCESIAPRSLFNSVLHKVNYSAICGRPYNATHWLREALLLQRATLLRAVRWRERVVSSVTADSAMKSRLKKQEAHTMTTLCEGRFVVIVNGWGVSHSNHVQLLDSSALLQCSETDGSLLLYPGETISIPRFRYGFSAVEYEGDIILLGGCTQGGYSGEVNDLYRINISFDLSDGTTIRSAANGCGGMDRDFACGLIVPPGEEANSTSGSTERGDTGVKRWVRGFTARYSENLTPQEERIPSTAIIPHLPLPRGYHSSCVTTLHGRSCMVVWGGLHGDAPTGNLEILDLRSMRWRPGAEEDVSGAEPTPRFGHSCVLISADDLPTGFSLADRLIFTGGSDGNDLVRNGRELREIHILSVIHSSNNSMDSDRLVWSTPSIHSSTGISNNLIPGRCHCATPFGRHIIFFGGGAQHSNRVTVLTIDEAGEDLTFRMSTPIVHKSTKNLSVQLNPTVLSPMPRCSAATALIGNRILLFGGFSTRGGYLGDIWSLDLTAAEDRNGTDVIADEDDDTQVEEEEESHDGETSTANLLWQLIMASGDVQGGPTTENVLFNLIATGMVPQEWTSSDDDEIDDEDVTIEE